MRKLLLILWFFMLPVISSAGDWLDGYWHEYAVCGADFSDNEFKFCYEVQSRENYFHFNERQFLNFDGKPVCSLNFEKNEVTCASDLYELKTYTLNKVSENEIVLVNKERKLRLKRISETLFEERKEIKRIAYEKAWRDLFALENKTLNLFRVEESLTDHISGQTTYKKLSADEVVAEDRFDEADTHYVYYYPKRLSFGENNKLTINNSFETRFRLQMNGNHASIFAQNQILNDTPLETHEDFGFIEIEGSRVKMYLVDRAKFTNQDGQLARDISVVNIWTYDVQSFLSNANSKNIK